MKKKKINFSCIPFTILSSMYGSFVTIVTDLMFILYFQMCRLIVSEIITSPCNTTRVERIGNTRIHYFLVHLNKNEIFTEKWTAVADICRCLHNYNGVFQVCAAFTNSSVYRLRKTWDRIGKTVNLENMKILDYLWQFQTKSTIEKLQAIVSSDGRHRNLRDALHRYHRH